MPFSAYFLEPCQRRYLYLGFAILGAMLGAVLYVPYFAHERWLVTRFYDYAISYQGTVLLDFIVPRKLTYLLYIAIIIVPLITSSKRNVKIFGALIIFVVMAVFAFFRFAYVSAFCFGGAVMSTFIVWMVFRETGRGQPELAQGT